jgi:hypothetical protein
MRFRFAPNTADLRKEDLTMRLNKILAIAALSASVAALNAQATMTLTSNNNVPIGGWVVYDLTFDLSSANQSVWNSWALRLRYDNTKMEVFMVRTNAGLNNDPRVPGSQGYVSLTSLGSNYTFSTTPAIRIAAASGLNGLAAGQTYAVTNPGTTEFAVSIASPADPNNFTGSNLLFTRTNAAGNARIPIKVAINTEAVGIGNTVGFTLVDQSYVSEGVRYPLTLAGGTFTVVPEPASMIALGSGLVGLMALRRRNKK